MKSMYCKIKGHNLVELNKDFLLVKEYQCKNCHKEFTIDGYGKIVKLTPYWIQNNLVFKNNKNYSF